MKRSIKFLFAVVMTGAVFTGCLKDDDYNSGRIQSTHNDGNTSQKLIEIKLTAGDTSNFLLLSLDAVNHDTIMNLIPVNLASALPAPEDIHVTLVANPTMVANYNAANGTNYVIPPANMYQILNSGNVVTIPAGSHTGYLQIKLKPADFIGQEWALAFSIASVDKPGYIISGNMNKGMVGIAVKNKYDGVYNLRIKTVGWAAYGIADGVSVTYPGGTGLITASATSVTIFNYLRGDDLQPGFTGGLGFATSPTAFGATTPRFTFDPNTDQLVSVVNTTPDDGRGRTLFLNPAVTNSRFDPATRTIYAAYVMTQNGRPNQLIYDTLTYVGPR